MNSSVLHVLLAGTRHPPWAAMQAIEYRTARRPGARRLMHTRRNTLASPYVLCRRCSTEASCLLRLRPSLRLACLYLQLPQRHFLRDLPLTCTCRACRLSFVASLGIRSNLVAV